MWRSTIQKLKIQAVLLILRLLGHQTDDRGRDAVRLQILHDADTLIALLHIELVHKFISHDGIADPICFPAKRLFNSGMRW